MNRMRILLICTPVVLAIAAMPAMAQRDSTELQKALDKPITLKIADAPIGDVFERISKASGVKLVIDADTFACLPYGRQTRLSVTLANATLRKRLGALLAGAALQWEIRGNEVHIRPSEALRRMCRRATYDELKVLAVIHSHEHKPAAKAGPVINQLRKATGNSQLKVNFHVKADEKAAIARADRALPATAAAWLDMLCHGRGWTWYLWGDDIIIMDKVRQVQRQLQKQVSLRCQNADLVTVLQDLAGKGKLMLEMAPGVLRYLPDQTRTNFNLVMADASIAQALQVISGATGLKFTPTAAGVRVEASEMLLKRARPTTRRARRAPFFVKLTLPLKDGSTVEVFMRADELPDEVVKAIEAKRKKFIAEMREAVKKTNKP